MNRPARRAIAFYAALAIVALLALAGPASASAGESAADALQQRVDSILAEYPGGVQTAANEVSWGDGDVVLTLNPSESGAAPLAVGSCASGKYYAYSGLGLSGSKLTFTTCGTTHSTDPIGRVRSLANARLSGYIQAKNSGGVVLATVSANSSLPSAPIARHEGHVRELTDPSTTAETMGDPC